MYPQYDWSNTPSRPYLIIFISHYVSSTIIFPVIIWLALVIREATSAASEAVSTPQAIFEPWECSSLFLVYFYKILKEAKAIATYMQTMKGLMPLLNGLGSGVRRA